MENTHTKLFAAALIGALAPTSVVKTPNMLGRNPWLTESVYPTSHFNPNVLILAARTFNCRLELYVVVSFL